MGAGDFGDGPSEVDALLQRVGLERYKQTLREHGLFTLEDLREGKGTLQLVLPLGPKARLLKELGSSEGHTQGGSEYTVLVGVLRPYASALTALTARLHDAARKNPGGTAGKHYVIASTTLKLCDKAVKESLRYQALSKRGNPHVQADMQSCKIAVGSAVRQLRQQQKQGLLRTIEDADPSMPLPALDLGDVTTIGVLLSPQKGRGGSGAAANRTPTRRREPGALDAPLAGALRALKQPTELVVSAILVMLRAFGYEEASWPAAKARLGSHAFLQELSTFSEESIPDSVLTLMGDYVTNPDYAPELVRSACAEAGLVDAWIRRVYDSCMRTRTGGPGSGATPPAAAAPSPIVSPTSVDNDMDGADDALGGGGGGNSRLPTARALDPFATPGTFGASAAAARGSPAQPVPPPQPAAAFAHSPRSCAHSSCNPGQQQQQQQWTSGVSVSEQQQQQLAQRERDLRAREAAVAEREARLLQRERDIDARADARHAPTPQAAAAGAATGAATGAASREEAAKLHSLAVQTATAGALLAHLCEKTRPPPPPPDTRFAEDDEAELDAAEAAGGALRAADAAAQGGVGAAASCIPVGSHVEVTTVTRGLVAGWGRGRVGVKFPGAKAEVGVLPAHLRLPEQELRDLPAEFPIGTPVSVGAAMGTVTGHSRGRVGVELHSGEKKGVPPERVRVLSDDEVIAATFPKGTPVVVLQEAVVTGAARGRVGVRLTVAGEARGVVPEEVMRVESPDLSQLFPDGTAVAVRLADGRTRDGVVTGRSRGRVGVQVSGSGEAVGAIPADVTRKDSTDGLLVEYPIGLQVLVRHVQGVVAGVSRGRVGVVDEAGQHVGALPHFLRERELCDEELRELFDVGANVRVGGRHGVVTGVSRGRVGVEYRDGAKGGVLPAHATVIGEDEVNRFAFPVGLEVFITEEGVVTGQSRGRVGVRLENGESRGVVPEQIRLLPAQEHLDTMFPVGTRVTVDADTAEAQRGATVSGHSRGRVGVVLAGGEKLGVTPDRVRSEAAPQEGLLRDFPVGAGVVVSVVRGEVESHSRGRVAVRVDATGKLVGALPTRLHVVELTLAELQEKYEVGMHVCVGPQPAVVTGCSRGRVGVEFENGTHAGLTPDKIRLLSDSESLSKTYPLNTYVEVTRRFEGTLVGHSRGRCGVILQNGDKLGVMPEQVTLRKQRPVDALPVGASVCVTLHAKVLGHSRGRVGVELPDGTHLGVLPATVVKTDDTGVCSGTQPSLPTCKHSQDFPVGTAVLYEGRLARVMGHSRGRVGIECENGDKFGAVPQQLSRAPKTRVSLSKLKALRSAADGPASTVCFCCNTAKEEERKGSLCTSTVPTTTQAALLDAASSEHLALLTSAYELLQHLS